MPPCRDLWTREDRKGIKEEDGKGQILSASKFARPWAPPAMTIGGTQSVRHSAQVHLKVRFKFKACVLDLDLLTLAKVII